MSKVIHFNSSDNRFCGVETKQSYVMDESTVTCPDCLRDTRLASSPKYPGMTNLALAVARLQEVPNRYEGDTFSNILKAQDALMEKSNQDARRAKTLVGRTISSHVADGCAIYEVCWVKGAQAFLRHIDYCDGYRARDMEQMAKVYKDPLDEKGVVFQVSKRFVESRVQADDKLAAIFASRK